MITTHARQLGRYEFSHLDALDVEAVFVFREVAAELERPVLLFSGGKDSIVLLRLAERAFRPAAFPFPVIHIDTGHIFDEVLSTSATAGWPNWANASSWPRCRIPSTAAGWRIRASGPAATASRPPPCSTPSPSTASTPASAELGATRRRPGHVQYTHNMVIGASTADLAVILVDARKPP